jgi:hypothetical protein
MSDMIVRMWEVKVHPEAMGDVLNWLCDSAVPTLEHDPNHVHSEIYSSTDNRIVVISKWRANPIPLPDPPRYQLDRPPHAWDFSPVDR